MNDYFKILNDGNIDVISFRSEQIDEVYTISSTFEAEDEINLHKEDIVIIVSRSYLFPDHLGSYTEDEIVSNTYVLKAKKLLRLVDLYPYMFIVDHDEPVGVIYSEPILYDHEEMEHIVPLIIKRLSIDTVNYIIVARS